jgi:hypothetical protein
MTDALPAAALAVSKPRGPVNPGLRGPDQPALRRAVAIRGTTTAAAATAAWAMAGVTGLPRRASTVALVALVGAELGQTLLDSHAPLVVLTTVGSMATMATLISIPVVSQLLGCTPLDPLGWAQALGTAAAATVALAVANGVAEKWGSPGTQPQPIDDVPVRSGQSPQPPRATTTRRNASGARRAPKRPVQPAGRPGSRAST